MQGLRLKRRRGHSRADVGSYWLSFSDLLSSLLLVFVLALVFSIYQYYSQLDLKTRELSSRRKSWTAPRSCWPSRRRSWRPPA